MHLTNKHRASSRSADDPDAELQVLEWKYRDFLQLSRLDELKRHLDSGRELVVQRGEHTFSRFKLIMRLDNGWTVHLKLHRPVDVPFRSITSIRWSNSSSWIIDGRSSDGEELRCYAWRVIVTFCKRDLWGCPIDEGGD